MVNGNKRLFGAHRKPLCIAHSHKQRSDKPGGIGHRNSIYVVKRAACGFKRLRDNTVDVLGVAA